MEGFLTLVEVAHYADVRRDGACDLRPYCNQDLYFFLLNDILMVCRHQPSDVIETENKLFKHIVSIELRQMVEVEADDADDEQNGNTFYIKLQWGELLGLSTPTGTLCVKMLVHAPSMTFF